MCFPGVLMFRSPMLSLGLVLAAACRYDVEIVPVEVPEPDYDFTFELERDVTTAGQAVGYTVTVTNWGEPVENARWTLTSDVEDYVSHSTDEVTPTQAGSHELTLTVAVGDWSAIATADVDVFPANAYDLDLVLSDVAMSAGESLAYDLNAVDRYGNSVGTQLAVVAPDSLEVVVDENAKTATGTVPGFYLLTASMDGLSDVEPIVIEAGPAAAMSLSVRPQWPSLYETAHADVEVTDAYGNEVWAPWVLSANRMDAVHISGSNMTFNQEGWHTITAYVPGTSLTETAGPFLIDAHGPEIDVITPERGTWTTALTQTVSGTATDTYSATVDLTVNGTAVPVAQDGSFSQVVDMGWGTNVLETAATDEVGNASSDVRAVLAGSFKPYGQRVATGIDACINEGPGGLGTLATIGEDLINAQDLTALIPNPIYSNENRRCYDPCGGIFGGCRVCVTWYSVNVSVRNPRVGTTDLLIDPKASGNVLLRGTINNPHLEWTASGKVIGIGYSGSGAIDANYIRVDIDTRLRAANERLEVDVVSVNGSTNGFNFQWVGWLEDVLNFFGFDLDGFVADAVEGAVEDAVRDQVPPLLEDTLNELELVTAFPVAGRQFTLDAAPTAVIVNDRSITLGLGTKLLVDSWVHPGQGLGSLYGEWGRPNYPASPGMQIAFGADFLNQVTYGAWGAGLLDIEEPLSALGAGDELELIFPGSNGLTAVVNPLLPPVIVPGTGAAEYDLQLGDLELTIYDGNPADGNIRIQVYVSAVAGLDVGNVGDDRLTANVGNADFWFDVVVPEGNTQAAADTELLLEALIPMLLPRITDVISEIDVPSFSGFGITNLQTRADGEDASWFVLGGNLRVE